MTVDQDVAEEAISILQDLGNQGIFFVTAIEGKDTTSCDFQSIGLRISELMNKLGLHCDTRIP